MLLQYKSIVWSVFSHHDGYFAVWLHLDIDITISDIYDLGGRRGSQDVLKVWNVSLGGPESTTPSPRVISLHAARCE